MDDTYTGKRATVIRDDAWPANRVERIFEMAGLYSGEIANHARAWVLAAGDFEAQCERMHAAIAIEATFPDVSQRSDRCRALCALVGWRP